MLKNFILWLGFSLAVGLSCLVSAKSDKSDLNSSLERSIQQAKYWQYGWLTVHGASTLMEMFEAGRTHSKADRRAHQVGAVSSALGVVDLLINPLYWPEPDNRSGAKAYSAGHKLRGIVEEIQQRTSWKGHLSGWFIALAGALITASGPGRDSDALEYFFISGLAAELQIWSLPRRPVNEWKHLSNITDDHPMPSKPVSGYWPVVQAVPKGVRLHWLF